MGVKKGSCKNVYPLAFEYRDLGHEMPEKRAKKYETKEWIMKLCQKKRRNDRCSGCMANFKEEC